MGRPDLDVTSAIQHALDGATQPPNSRTTHHGAKQHNTTWPSHLSCTSF